ncbi:hypothetical protein AAT19DRAFT_10208 [Rhodotorula toruloides]|uniref:Uncharacterized protein n=1 Tax=Rhodotorula toruloides TaxID=5286 RepID=A0A2T0A018_RHOTO|nr:hypothetical protein AAT19DRAFT_10208 [Rhodotorula toruloides]
MPQSRRTFSFAPCPSPSSPTCPRRRLQLVQPTSRPYSPALLLLRLCPPRIQFLHAETLIRRLIRTGAGQTYILVQRVLKRNTWRDGSAPSLPLFLALVVLRDEVETVLEVLDGFPRLLVLAVALPLDQVPHRRRSRIEPRRPDSLDLIDLLAVGRAVLALRVR